MAKPVKNPPAKTKPQTKAISTDVVDFSQDMGVGFENLTAADQAIPFLRVLQSGSPACEPRGEFQVEGAVAGHFMNTVTEEVYDGEDGVSVVPCHYERVFIEWKPDRGGFVKQYSVSQGEMLLAECEKDEDGKDIMPHTGNILTDTRNWYLILVPDDADQVPIPVLLSLTSTQLKKSKKWMSTADGLRLPGNPNPLPIFSHTYRITTIGESNDRGSWFGIKVALEDMVRSKALYDLAKKFREGVQSGAVKAQAPTQEGEADYTPGEEM